MLFIDKMMYQLEVKDFDMETVIALNVLDILFFHGCHLFVIILSVWYQYHKQCMYFSYFISVEVYIIDQFLHLLMPFYWYPLYYLLSRT